MLEVYVPQSVLQLPDLHVGSLPNLRELVSRFGRDHRFLRVFLDFQRSLNRAGYVPGSPSLWPIWHPQDLSGYFDGALASWGPGRPQDVRPGVPIHIRDTGSSQPVVYYATEYLSGGIPVLYRVLGQATPRVRGDNLYLSPDHAAAIAINAAYNETLKASGQS